MFHSIRLLFGVRRLDAAFIKPTAALMALLCFALIASAQPPAKNAKKLADAAKGSKAAADTFTEIMNVPDKAIPQNLLDKAEAVAVFEMVKAGFIVGGRTGHGVISRRVKGGWSPPAFYNLNGGSFGLQIGASKTYVVLLFMNTGAIDALMQDKFEIGGEGSAAAGPVGRSAAASTDAQLKAQILSYSRSKGLFAGTGNQRGRDFAGQQRQPTGLWNESERRSITDASLEIERYAGERPDFSAHVGEILDQEMICVSEARP